MSTGAAPLESVMKMVVPVLLGACVVMSHASASAQSPLARSVSSEAVRLAAHADPAADPDDHAEAVDLRWSELAAIVVGQHVTLRLSDGTSVHGEALVVREDALVIATPARKRGSVPDGRGAAIPRSLVHTIEVRKMRGDWGRHLGTRIGMLSGIVIGGYLSGTVANSAGTGIPMFLGIAAGTALAGYYAGRQLDTQITLIHVIA